MRRKARAAVEVPDDEEAAPAHEDDAGEQEPAPTEDAADFDLDLEGDAEPEDGDDDGAAPDVEDLAGDRDEDRGELDDPAENGSADDDDADPVADVDVDDGDGAPVRTDPEDLRDDFATIALAETPLQRVRAASHLAGRLVECAEEGDTIALASFLRGHPRREATVWRVHHFRLGDVTPSVSAAHDDPGAAVLGLARSGDGALVAGELIAVDADGSAWTALARTDDEVVVQLPSPRTVTGPAAAPDAVGPLLLAWRHALGAHARAATPPAPAGEPTAKPAAVSTEPEAPPTASVPAPEPARPGSTKPSSADLAATLDRLDAPGAPLDRLQAALQADLAARLTAVEARLALAAEEGARVAVARALDEIRDELVGIRDQLARLEPPSAD